jgi:hypothetical protein
MVYDARGRLVNTQTFRTKPSWWTSGGTGAPASYKAPGTSELVSQAILESRSVTYDEADNPVLIADGRTASEWPAGAKPVTKRIAGIALSVRDVVSAPADERMGVARQVGASMLGGWAGAQGAAFLFLGAGSVAAAWPVVLVTVAAGSVVGSIAGWEAAR